MLKVVHDEAEPSEASGSVLDEIVREAARQMLAVALQAEVSAYIDAHAEEVDENGHRVVVRNGHHNEREVITAAGPVPGLLGVGEHGRARDEPPDVTARHRVGDDADRDVGHQPVAAHPPAAAPGSAGAAARRSR